MADSEGRSPLLQGVTASWVPTQVPQQIIKLPAADQVSNRIVAARTMCFLLDDGVDPNTLKHSIEIAVARTVLEIPRLAGRVTWEDERRSSIQVVIPEEPRIEVRFSDLSHVNALELDAEAWPPYKIRLSEHFMIDRGFQAIENSCFALQANFMIGGFTLVFHLNHAVMDGTAFSTVVASFAGHLGKVVDASPIRQVQDSSERTLERPAASKSGAGHIIAQKVDPADDKTKLEQPDKAKTHTIWRISQQKIEELCALYRMHDSLDFRTSTVNCISILLWRTITRAWNSAPDSTTTAFWPVDVRNRVQPALSASYIGNALCQGKLGMKVKDLEKTPNEMAFKMQQITNSWDDRTVRERWASIDQSEDLSTFKKKPQDPGTAFDCTSLLNIPCYGLHWGNGVHPRRWRFPPVGLGDGFVAILPRLPGGQGIEISLHMYQGNLLRLLGDETFRSYFDYGGGSSAWLADAAASAGLSS